ncbi:MAG TPA: peptidylprolyl isomerase, partial [Candidatus Krumholzibacterium sp.]|nr:peptidylprolyl isomerase [Candidatus Krumholzibacterium sp.]
KMTVITALGPLAKKEDPASETRGRIVKLLKSAMKEADPRIPDMASKQGGYLGLKLIPDPLLARGWDRGVDPEEQPALPMGEKRIALVTSRGRIEIVMFGDEAPAMVHSFLKLAGEGFYKGLNFHRVVPGFVVQGGCPRGDGWGDAGFFLRSEINAHRYERGAMGVAHAGKDTPGSQFFLTHVAQPHLDGRYTVIGRIEKGLEIIDSIEIGDTIDIRVLD